MANVVDYYAVLGVPQDADDSQIKAAFRKLAKQFSSASEPGAKQLKEAFDILTDPRKREQYDAYLAEQGLSQGSADEQANGPGRSTVTHINGATPASASRWEYLTLKSSRNYGTTKYYVNDVQQRDLKNAQFHDVINMIGEEGWEMVGIAVVGNEQTYIFKRPQDR